jgi:hypothetical protein
VQSRDIGGVFLARRGGQAEVGGQESGVELRGQLLHGVAFVAPFPPSALPQLFKDHIVPLACGGPDAASDLQWQTIQEAKAKDKRETKGCRRLR